MKQQQQQHQQQQQQQQQCENISKSDWKLIIVLVKLYYKGDLHLDQIQK